jgi:hypothetical protein
MTTKTTLRLINAAGLLLVILFSLMNRDRSSRYSGGLVTGCILVSLVAMALVVYAYCREKGSNDKSPTIPARAFVAIAGVFVLWAAICFFRVWRYGM